MGQYEWWQLISMADSDACKATTFSPLYHVHSSYQFQMLLNNSDESLCMIQVNHNIFSVSIIIYIEI